MRPADDPPGLKSGLGPAGVLKDARLVEPRLQPTGVVVDHRHVHSAYSLLNDGGTALRASGMPADDSPGLKSGLGPAGVLKDARLAEPRLQPTGVVVDRRHVYSAYSLLNEAAVWHCQHRVCRLTIPLD